LNQRNIELAQSIQLIFRFHSFGNQDATTRIGDLVHCPDKMKLERIPMNVGNEMPVNLDEFGPYFRPHAKIGKSFAQVVHGNTDTHTPNVRQSLFEIGELGNAFTFGQFDDDPRWRNAKAEQLLAQRLKPLSTVVQATGTHIQKQAQGRPLTGIFLQR